MTDFLCDDVDFAVLQHTSGIFLAEPIPDDWRELTIEAREDFLIEHEWEKLTTEGSADLWAVIVTTAENLQGFVEKHYTPKAAETYYLIQGESLSGGFCWKSFTETELAGMGVDEVEAFKRHYQNKHGLSDVEVYSVVESNAPMDLTRG